MFKIGAAVDPVTGQRCRGTAFIDEEMRQLEEAQILEERGNKSVQTWINAYGKQSNSKVFVYII